VLVSPGHQIGHLSSVVLQDARFRHFIKELGLELADERADLAELVPQRREGNEAAEVHGGGDSRENVGRLTSANTFCRSLLLSEGREFASSSSAALLCVPCPASLPA
jgi:hypothetical protein